MSFLAVLIILAAPQGGADSPPATGEEWLRRCEAKNTCTAGVMGFYHGLAFGATKPFVLRAIQTKSRISSPWHVR